MGRRKMIYQVSLLQALAYGDYYGSITSADYTLVKRACFGSYKLNASETIQADVDGSGKIDATDYVLIKRMSFGTYQSK